MSKMPLLCVMPIVPSPQRAGMNSSDRSVLRQRLRLFERTLRGFPRSPHRCFSYVPMWTFLKSTPSVPTRHVMSRQRLSCRYSSPSRCQIYAISSDPQLETALLMFKMLSMALSQAVNTGALQYSLMAACTVLAVLAVAMKKRCKTTRGRREHVVNEVIFLPLSKP